MDLRPLIPLGCLAGGAAALFGLDRLVRWMARRGWVAPPREEGVRRSVGHAMLGLQQLVEPGIEYIVEAENAEQKEQDGESGDGADEPAIRADLATSLGFTPVDPEEVRRHLATAQRAGLDWRRIYDEAVRAELTARPYRAPTLPPPARVAPRE